MRTTQIFQNSLQRGRPHPGPSHEESEARQHHTGTASLHPTRVQEGIRLNRTGRKQHSWAVPGEQRQKEKGALATSPLPRAGGERERTRTGFFKFIYFERETA